MSAIKPSQRVVIIGAGQVGASVAFATLTQEIASEILLIDIAEELAKAQVLDLQDAAVFTKGVKVSYANYSDLIDGDIVVITCGVARKEGQSRLDLMGINAKIMASVAEQIKTTKKQVYLVVVTNPVDILTYIAVKKTGLPVERVFGTGTLLDTARLRNALSQEINISPDNIQSYTIGEHGDSSASILSSGSVNGLPLSNFMTIDDKAYENITSNVRAKAAQIIAGKKATYYGIGAAVSKVVKAIIKDENAVIPLSIMMTGEYGIKGVCLGVPVCLGAAGVDFVGELSLTKDEEETLQYSAKVLKENIEQLKTILPEIE